MSSRHTSVHEVGVAIIGSGFSGIYTLKYCLDQGLDAWIYEKSPRIGGVWNVANKPGGVHDFTYSVTSKLYMSSTEFAPPDEYAEFPHSSLVYKRLESYTDHFGLRARIKHGFEAVHILKNNDAGGGRLLITFLANGSEHVEVHAHRVVIATGTSMCPAYPDNKELYKRFKGLVVHSHYYNEHVRDACKGKRVLIVGGSDHASDIAADLSKVAVKGGIYVSIKDGQWFQDRMFSAEAPADMFYNRFADFAIKNIVGKKYINEIIGEVGVKHWWGQGGSDVAEWQPKCDYLNAYYNKSRDLVRLVGFGIVKPCGPVRDIQSQTIFCEGRNPIFEVDAVIMCTGYKYSACMSWARPYVQQPRYKHVFPVAEQGRVAFVGYIRPYLTSIPMLIELQARLVAKVFAGHAALPTETQLRYMTKKDEDRTRIEFACNAQRIPFIVDPYDYCNALARLIRALPSSTALLFKEPFLWYCCMFDSWNQYYYRLNDPDPKLRQLAREVILTYHTHHSSIRVRGFMLAFLADATIKLAVIFLVLLAVWKFRCYIFSRGKCPV